MAESKKLAYVPKSVRMPDQPLIHTHYVDVEVTMEDGRKKKKKISRSIALSPNQLTEVPSKVYDKLMGEERYEGLILSEEAYKAKKSPAKTPNKPKL